MPKKPNNQQKALQQRLADNLAKYADDNARRAAILRKNAQRCVLFCNTLHFHRTHKHFFSSSRAVKLATQALNAVRELSALEDAMASEAPDVRPSFVASPRHSLKNVEETLGAVVDECGKSK